MNYALRVSLSSSKRFPILMKSMYFVQEGDVSIKKKGCYPDGKILYELQDSRVT